MKDETFHFQETILNMRVCAIKVISENSYVHVGNWVFNVYNIRTF